MTNYRLGYVFMKHAPQLISLPHKIVLLQIILGTDTSFLNYVTMVLFSFSNSLIDSFNRGYTSGAPLETNVSKHLQGVPKGCSRSRFVSHYADYNFFPRYALRILPEYYLFPE